MVHENGGYNCEQYLKNKFLELGAQVNTRNLHYDLEIQFSNKNIRKIEIKSCKFQTNFKRVRKFGRFDFKYKYNLKKIQKEAVWLCFIVYIKECPEIIGFINPKKIDINKRFYSLQEVINLRTISWESFVHKLKLKKIKNG